MRFETPAPSYAVVTPQTSHSVSSQSTYSEIHKRSSSVPAGKKTLSGGSKFENPPCVKSESRRTKSLAEFAATVCGGITPPSKSTSTTTTTPGQLRGGLVSSGAPIVRTLSSYSGESSPEEQTVSNSSENRVSSYSTMSSFDSANKRSNSDRNELENSYYNTGLKSGSPKVMSGGTLFPTSMNKSFSAEFINKIQNQTQSNPVKVVCPESPVRDLSNTSEAENSFGHVFSPRRSVLGSHILVGGGGRNKTTPSNQQ